MDILNSYFDDLIFTRVDEKEGFVIYGAGIASGLGGGKKRYALAFVPFQLAFKRQAKLNELKWQNLQTRSLNNSYNLKSQPWSMPRDAPDVLLINRERQKNYSTYGAVDAIAFPFEILLLHDPRKKTIYQYNNKIMLKAAVDTFEAIINIIDVPIISPLQQPKFIPPSIQNWFDVKSKGMSDDAFELL